MNFWMSPPKNVFNNTILLRNSNGNNECVDRGADTLFVCFIVYSIINLHNLIVFSLNISSDLIGSGSRLAFGGERHHVAMY